MNEETIIEKRPVVKGLSEKEHKGNPWKHVTLGGVSGVLMGAGLMYVSQAAAKESDDEKIIPTVDAPEVGETSYTLENGLKVAAVNENLSFGEAFAQAREEVGPGGVFHWHGGIYNTYSAEEWNRMTIQEKHDFAQQVQPEVHPDDLSIPTDTNPQVVVVHHVYQHEVVSEVQQTPPPPLDDVQIVEQGIAQNFYMGEDVHIVGLADAEGHLVVGYDTTGDGQADIAIIDMDNDLHPSDPDIIMDRDGNMASLGELNQEPDPNQMISTENPDLVSEIPDNGNDALFDI